MFDEHELRRIVRLCPVQIVHLPTLRAMHRTDPPRFESTLRSEDVWMWWVLREGGSYLRYPASFPGKSGRDWPAGSPLS